MGGVDKAIKIVIHLSQSEFYNYVMGVVIGPDY